MSLKALQDRYRALIAEGDTLAAKGDMTADDFARLGTITTEMDTLKGQLETATRFEGAKAWAGQSTATMPLLAATHTEGNPPRSEGLRSIEQLREPPDGQGNAARAVVEEITAAGQTVIKQTRRGPGGIELVLDEGEGIFNDAQIKATMTPQYKAAFRSYIRGGINALSGDAVRTLQEGSDPAGGYLVPAEILTQIIEKQPAPTNVSSRVQVLQTSRDHLTIPKLVYTTDNIYTTGMRVTWTGEVPASATTHRVTDPVFGQVNIPVYTAMMSLPLTNDMVEDAMFPVVSWASAKFSETIALLRDNMALNGTGINQPSGMLVNPGATDNPDTVVSGAASSLTWDGLTSLAFALNEQYDGNSVFVFNKTNTGLAIAQMADGNGRPLWSTGSQDFGGTQGFLNRPLLGYPVMFNAFMPNVGANTYPIAFGDLTGYTQVNRVGFSIQVLRELYAETNQILLLGRLRFGGLVTEPWKLKIQKVST